jgi:DNA polymerase III gamma/tau subunit
MNLNNAHVMKDIDEFVGNKTLKTAIISILEREVDIPQVYLFHGASGCGKSALARVFGEFFGVESLNYKATNAGDDRTLVAMREIIKSANFAPFGENTYRVIVFEEAHQLRQDAKQALLDFLERPPAHVMIVFTTTDPAMFLKGTAMERRCFIGKVNPITPGQMNKYLKDVLNTSHWSAGVISALIKKAAGSIGHMLMLVDSIKDIGNQEAIDFLDDVISIETPPDIANLCRCLLKGDSWENVSDLLQNLNGDGESLRFPIKNYLSKVLLNDHSEFCAMMLQQFLPSFISSGKEGLIAACYECSLLYAEYEGV